jgi:protein SCO1/2
MLRKSWGTLIAVYALIFAAGAGLLSRPAQAENRWGANYFPNVELTTQDGNKVHFYDDLIKGKIVAIELFYTHCEYMCPLETARLAQVQRILGDRVGKEIFFYSLSIDPKRDTPEAMKAYAEKYHAGPGWTFLTGKKDDIDYLSKKLGLYSNPDVNADGHTAFLLIGNESAGQWMRNSALENPKFLAMVMGDMLNSYKFSKGKQTNYAEARQMNFDKGKYLFARQCAACHTIGHGDTIGPDLLGVANARNRDWLVRKIEVPEQLVKDKDPLTMVLFEKYKQVRMPDLGLDHEQTDYLIAFLAAQYAAGDKAAADNRESGAANPAGINNAPIAPQK